jgi:hypothetical protein
MKKLLTYGLAALLMTVTALAQSLHRIKDDVLAAYSKECLALGTGQMSKRSAQDGPNLEGCRERLEGKSLSRSCSFCM